MLVGLFISFFANPASHLWGCYREGSTHKALVSPQWEKSIIILSYLIYTGVKSPLNLLGRGGLKFSFEESQPLRSFQHVRPLFIHCQGNRIHLFTWADFIWILSYGRLTAPWKKKHNRDDSIFLCVSNIHVYVVYTYIYVQYVHPCVYILQAVNLHYFKICEFQ